VCRFMTSNIRTVGLPRLAMPGRHDVLNEEFREHLMRTKEDMWPCVDGVPVIDPVHDMPLDRVASSEDIANVKVQLGKLESSVQENLFAWKSPQHKEKCRKEYYEYISTKKRRDAHNKRIEISGQGKFKEQLEQKGKVLRRLGYLDDDNTLTEKGIFGCSIESVDELVITELLFEGIFNELTMEESIAFLSAFLPHGRANTKIRPSEPLRNAYDKLKAKATHLCMIQKEARLEIDENKYLSQFENNVTMVVLAWVNGKTFRECSEMTDMFEGNIVRMLRRIDELLRQLIDAVKSIGNEELCQKFSKGQAAITRGIAFAASLYIGEEDGDGAESDEGSTSPEDEEERGE